MREKKKPGALHTGFRRQSRGAAHLSTTHCSVSESPGQVFHNWIAEGGPSAWSAFDATYELLRELRNAGLVARDDPEVDGALRRALASLTEATYLDEEDRRAIVGMVGKLLREGVSDG